MAWRPAQGSLLTVCVAPSVRRTHSRTRLTRPRRTSSSCAVPCYGEDELPVSDEDLAAALTARDEAAGRALGLRAMHTGS
ncbi:hypothetical protein [Streptomyces achromogenes]|uniref:hypothetical protein n=1 Tax=Streptomyces achromogenes TaxID=67255 RepID=UPI0033CA9BC8